MVDERMNRWPVCWRREGRGGWRELVLEMEKKKKADINLALCFSLSSRHAQRLCPLRGGLAPPADPPSEGFRRPR